MSLRHCFHRIESANHLMEQDGTHGTYAFKCHARIKKKLVNYYFLRIHNEDSLK